MVKPIVDTPTPDVFTPPPKILIEKPNLADTVKILEFGSHQSVISDKPRSWYVKPSFKYKSLESKYFLSYTFLLIGVVVLFSREDFHYLDLGVFFTCSLMAILLCPTCIDKQVSPTLMGASSSTLAVSNVRSNETPFDKLNYSARHTLPVYEGLARDLVQSNRSITIDAHSLKRITAEAQQLINKNYSRETEVDNGTLRNTILFTSCVIQTYQEGISYAYITPKRIGSMPWE